MKSITTLSGKYNLTTYFGTGIISRITAAGEEEVGGAGGCEDLLTSVEYKNFNLICK